MKKILICLPEEDNILLQEVAEKNNISKSALVSYLIKNYLDKSKKFIRTTVAIVREED